MLNIAELEAKTKEELGEIAKSQGMSGVSGLKKQDLVIRLLQVQAEQQGYSFASGVLETTDDGYGFLRQQSMLPGPNDVYISQSQIRRFSLRGGDMVSGQIRPQKNGEKYYSLIRVEAVNGIDPEMAKSRPHFGSLTPVFPNNRITLEIAGGSLSTRMVDLIAPIGRGQRGMVVSPPKAGKTILLKEIAKGITINHPDIHLMICLIGERPEEVTDMKRSSGGEVIAATFDEAVENQTRVAKLALDRAKRLVEGGRDVVILLDGITRLTRAYNLAMPSSGRTLSGGIDPVALHPPKKFFGAARNTDSDGSLTIIATCLVDTGSRMDDLIYEEFKGTGNMELHLERRLAERRIFPAVDILRSSTRREELQLDEETVKRVWLLRRMVGMINSDSSNPTEGLERVIERMARTPTNDEFLASIKEV